MERPMHCLKRIILRLRKSAKSLISWIDSDEPTLALTSAALSKMSVEKLTKKLKGDLPDNVEILSELGEDLSRALEMTKRAAQLPKLHANVNFYTRLEQLKAEAAVMGFNDMLTRLRDALRGPNGGTLAATIRKQFPGRSGR